MKFNKSAIALAVGAATAGLPLMAAAEGHATWYGSARYGLENVTDRFNDTGNDDESVFQFKNFGSRFGVKGERDLGDGRTAFGHWEAHMFGAALRDFKIGIKGGFGEVYMGDGINHAWDNVLTTDATWWYGGKTHITEGVQSNAVTWMGDLGAAMLGVTLQMNPDDPNDQEEALDAFEIAASFGAGPVTIGVGVTDTQTSDDPGDEDPEPVIGFVVKGSAGDIGYAVDFYSQADSGATEDDDLTSFQLQGTFGNFAAQFGSNDNGENTRTAIVLSYTHNMGPGTLMYFELLNHDPDVDDVDAETTIAAVLKHEIAP